MKEPESTCQGNNHKLNELKGQCYLLENELLIKEES